MLFNGCAVQKKPPLNVHIENDLKSAIFSKCQTGFSLYDLNTQKVVYEKDADKFFIPASNTKLLTYYAGLCALGDSVSTIKYIINQDSLIVWPQADPSFLHPDFPNQPAFDFLKNCNKNIYLINGSYIGEKFGMGWAWDDYNDYYATQITDLPIYGNMIFVSLNNGKLKIHPDLPAMFLCDTILTPNQIYTQRNPYNNNLSLPFMPAVNYSQRIPLNIDGKTTLVLLSDTILATGLITKEVKPLAYRKSPEFAKSIATAPADTLYKHMLQRSDNFLAEQLLLNMAYKNNVKTTQSAIINFIQYNYLRDLPDTLRWVDGSGLSRMNLNTPRNLTAILKSIYAKAGEKRAFEALSAGGVNGTLINQFKGDEVYVYAKTGSLSNNYCLSGFLIGNSGKRYAFSMMNNNFMLPLTNIRQEVERFITSLKNQL